MPREIVIQIPTFKEACTGIKNHVIEHKELYIGLGIGVLLTSAAVLVNETCNEIECGDDETPEANAEISQKVLAFKTGDVTQNVHIEQTVIRRGHPGKAILDPETGMQYPSILYAADHFGIAPATVRKKIRDGELIHMGDALPPQI